MLKAPYAREGHPVPTLAPLINQAARSRDRSRQFLRRRAHWMSLIQAPCESAHAVYPLGGRKSRAQSAFVDPRPTIERGRLGRTEPLASTMRCSFDKRPSRFQEGRTAVVFFSAAQA